jgi:ribonuclease HI
VEYLDERDLNIYIDGSSFSSPRRGGVGIFFVTEGPDGGWLETPYEVAGFQSATNNQMELQACIEALHALSRGRVALDPAVYRKLVFWTDSQYLANGFDSARYSWPRARWLTRDGNPVANTALWKELLRLATRVGRPVDFQWVKGHKDSFFNKRADKLAKTSAKAPVLRGPLDQRKVRRKTTTEAIQRGSVEMSGQQMTIRLFEELDQSDQGLVRFKYEVLSKRSPFFGKVDYIWAARGAPMRAGHIYRVRVNRDTRAPRIVKLVGEVERSPSGRTPGAGARA